MSLFFSRSDADAAARISMVSVMQPNMPGMIGMNYSSQMSQGPIAMQVLASS